MRLLGGVKGGDEESTRPRVLFGQSIAHSPTTVWACKGMERWVEERGFQPNVFGIVTAGSNSPVCDGNATCTFSADVENHPR
jgi:hypothetical protein